MTFLWGVVVVLHNLFGHDVNLSVTPVDGWVAFLVIAVGWDLWQARNNEEGSDNERLSQKNTCDPAKH